MYRHLDTLLDKGEFKNIRQRYAGKYPELSQFNHKLVNVIVTGAQNGANDAFDGIMNAFMAETPLPQSRHHARYLTPEIFPLNHLAKCQDSTVARPKTQCEPEEHPCRARIGKKHNTDTLQGKGQS